MRTVLVPLDGSATAESAIPIAATIAARWKARLLLAAVHEPTLPRHVGQGAPEIDRRWEEDARAALRAALATAAGRVATWHDDLQVESVLLEGGVVDALASEASRAEVDLAVLSSHGHGGPSRFWLGSVTDALVRRLEIPVLITRAHVPSATDTRETRPLLRVLVPLDGTRGSERIVETAVDVAGREGVHVALLRVAAPLHPFMQAFAGEREIAGDAEEQVEIAGNDLRAAEARLRGDGLEVSSAVRLDIYPAHAILRFADEIEADLIALATHGHGPIGRFLLGSVADKVLRGANVPVLMHRLFEDPGAWEPASPRPDPFEGPAPGGR